MALKKRKLGGWLAVTGAGGHKSYRIERACPAGTDRPRTGESFRAAGRPWRLNAGRPAQGPWCGCSGGDAPAPRRRGRRVHYSPDTDSLVLTVRRPAAGGPFMVAPFGPNTQLVHDQAGNLLAIVITDASRIMDEDDLADQPDQPDLI